MTEQKTLSKKLLVEGNDDKHVVLALCKKYAIAETFDVVDCKGIENLFEQIPIWFKTSGIDTIGVIVDADIDLNTRWHTIKNLLKPHGFSSTTEGLPDTGLIIRNGMQTFGVWIMPNNNTNGMLEDFISLLVPDSDKLLPIANTILKEIEEKKIKPLFKNASIESPDSHMACMARKSRHPFRLKYHKEISFS